MNKKLLSYQPSFWLSGIFGLSILICLGFEQITRFPRGLMTDDSFFYAKIAYNLGRYGLSSFDGVNVTDGYHLLWGWLLAVPAYFLSFFTPDPSFHLKAMLLLYFGLCWYIAGRFSQTIWQFIYFIFWGIILKIFMETTLLALFLLLFVHDELLSDKQSPTWLGSCLAFLVPFTRIDGIIFIAILSLGYVVKPRQIKKFLYIHLALLGGMLGQFACRKILFGSFTSVSSGLKASRMFDVYYNITQNLTGLYLGKLLSFALFIILCSAAFATINRAYQRSKITFYIIWASAGIFIIFQLLFNSDVRYWYYIPSFYLYLYIILRLSSSTPRYMQWMNHLILLGIITAFLGKWGVDSVIRKEQITYSREFITKVKDFVPPEELIFQIDGSGYVGFFSERHVVNGDGLVNTHEYATRLQKNNLSNYLKENNVQYIIHNDYTMNGELIHYHGLKILVSEIVTLIPAPQNFPSLTAYGLYRLKGPD